MPAVVTVAEQTLGGYIERQMERQRLTVETLAKRAQLSVGTVRNIIKGRTTLPDLTTLLSLAEALKMPLERLARVALGLPEQSEEPARQEPTPKQRLDTILDTLDPERQRLAERLLRDLAEWGAVEDRETEPPTD